jgi:hypothetical protein
MEGSDRMTVRKEINSLRVQEQAINNRIKAIQKDCPHKLCVHEAHGSSGSWDRDDSYWFNFYCYDCQKRWSHDQSLGSDKSMRVRKIDYDKNPRIIELEMEIASL